MSHPRPWEELDSNAITFGERRTSAAASVRINLQDWSLVSQPLCLPEQWPVSHRSHHIVIENAVLQQMLTHAQSDLSRELGGILLGHSFHVEAAPDQASYDSTWHGLWIRCLLPAQAFASTPTRLTFTHETWELWNRQRLAFPSSWSIVGWYHTHPRWGIFLSDWDQFLCQNFFDREDQIAIVVDPVQDRLGVFEWNSPQYDSQGKWIAQEPPTADRPSASDARRANRILAARAKWHIATPREAS